jgi:flagellar basal-body rod protein FlgB
MENQALFGGTLSVLEKVMDLRSRKHNLVISNIVNIDTPNYKGFDMVIDEELKKIPRSGHTMGMSRTDPNHFPVNQTDSQTISYDKKSLKPVTLRGDGNSVDLDNVMGEMAENSLMYNALAKIVKMKFRSLTNVIGGGK